MDDALPPGYERIWPDRGAKIDFKKNELTNEDGTVWVDIILSRQEVEDLADGMFDTTRRCIAVYGKRRKN